MKIARRLEKERRNDEFLTQKMIETDSDLVMVSTCHVQNYFRSDNITIVLNQILNIFFSTCIISFLVTHIMCYFIFMISYTSFLTANLTGHSGLYAYGHRATVEKR